MDPTFRRWGPSLAAASKGLILELILTELPLKMEMSCIFSAVKYKEKCDGTEEYSLKFYAMSEIFLIYFRSIFAEDVEALRENHQQIRKSFR